jgi:hyaluronoglucosaminidase
MAVNAFAIRGVVEGFYGVYYTVPQRLDLLRFLGAYGFNYYVYGPKDDWQHRRHWREPYPPEALAEFAQTVPVADACGITFCFALSPGVSMCYSAEADFAALTAKFTALHAVGVRAFCLLLDDIATEFKYAADAAVFTSYAAAHADLCRRTADWLKAFDPACTLSMCPTHYHGRPPFEPYLLELGRQLPPEMAVMYTGPQVCSPTITAADALAFAQAVGRPVLIWDNYPVNDTSMSAELHLGPIRGRAPDLAAAVSGLLVNPMNQPEASKIALHTFAAYFADPAGYDPAEAWEAALAVVAGPASAPALHQVAEHLLFSCLADPLTPALLPLAADVLATPPNASAPLLLEAELQRLEAAVYHLRNRCANLALRADLLPWLAQLERWLHVGLAALALLLAAPLANRAQLRRRLTRALAAARAHPERVAAEALADLAEAALRAADAVEAAQSA